jgi:hypothetical protein
MKKMLSLVITAITFVLSPDKSIAQTEKIADDLHVYSPPKQHVNCTPEIKFNPEIHENASIMLENSGVSFSWPLGLDLNEGVIMVNYVDNQTGNGIKDYMGNEWAYNGHNGTDMCLHDFRSMDRMVPVKAGASGRVVEIAFSNFDRNITWGGQPANIVGIRHSDGSYAYYYHLMKNSVIPRLGEYVNKGRTIGYVGSSGVSSDAHLHFEVGYFINDQWSKRDPWNGTYNTLPSMWDNQLPYVGTTPFLIHDMGVYTSGSVGGDVSTNTSIEKLKERIIAPVTVSGYEPRIGFWLHYQGTATNKTVRFELRRSNGTLMNNISFTLYNDYRNAWTWWTPVFNYGVEYTGNWYIRVLYDNVEVERCYFNVQLLTSIRPRLSPVAGKTFRRTAAVQRDTLRVRPVRNNMQYQLVDAPSGVTLSNDSILTISSYSQTSRVRQFKVIASLGGSSTLRDTMNYAIIDTTKNNTSNGIPSLYLTSYIEGLSRYQFFTNYMIRDTVTVQVRYPISPYPVMAEDKFELDHNGYGIANFPGLDISVLPFYYIAVKHRNSVETWSKTPIQFFQGVPITYDFTTAANKAFGDNLKLKTSKWCIYSGDVSQDGIVDLNDVLTIYNSSNTFTTGYVVTDINGDKNVDLNDVIISYNNASAFVGVLKP